MYGALKGRFNYQHGSWSNQIEGGLSFNTIMHELGHGLGLSHSFDGNPLFPGVQFNGWTDLGDNNLSQGIWTIMAYNHDWKDSPAGSDNWGFAKTPMTFDIAAMQAMYGANTTYRTGDNTYTLPTSEVAGTGWECIWDAGGTDTISNSGASADCNINLNAYPKTGGVASEIYVSYNVSSQIAGGFTIADGAVIENAVGGNGNDTLTGNAVSNQLTGNGGADKFVFNTALGANNIDTITDFAGTDIVVLDKTIFTAFQASATVSENHLHIAAGATAAADEDDYLIYNTTTGDLYYDQDGSANTYTAIQFAVLQTKPAELALTHVLLA
jgi:serralysin